MNQLSDSYTKVSRSAINLKIAIIIRFCMADELNGHALPVHHTNPYKNYNFQNDGTLCYFGLWLKYAALTTLGLCFPGCVLFMCFDQTWSKAVLSWQRSIVSVFELVWVHTYAYSSSFIFQVLFDRSTWIFSIALISVGCTNLNLITQTWAKKWICRGLS